MDYIITVYDRCISPPAEMNSRQSENLNCRDKINPLSLVKPSGHFSGKETEIFCEASRRKFSKCVHFLNVFVDLF